MSSFDEAITEEPKRFIGYAFDKNPNISDFGEFSKALEESMIGGEISEQTKIDLFEDNETKERIKENVSKEEFEKLYTDGDIVKREVIKGKVITITRPKIISKGYITKRTPKPIASYERGKPIKFTKAEARFLSIRKAKKLTPKVVIAQYNTHFKTNPRTASSIKSKFWRI
jgi:hypothetical protein